MTCNVYICTVAFCLFSNGKLLRRLKLQNSSQFVLKLLQEDHSGSKIHTIYFSTFNLQELNGFHNQQVVGDRFYIREGTTSDHKNYQKGMDQNLNLKRLPRCIRISSQILYHSRSFNLVQYKELSCSKYQQVGLQDYSFVFCGFFIAPTNIRNQCRRQPIGKPLTGTLGDLV